MYLDSPLSQYLKDLAARKPAPGGGSAAALTAATGAALMSMVANYTVGNPKYKDVENRAADILLKSENLRQELEGLIDADVEAYGKLSVAMKKKTGELEDAYREAVRPPYEVCRISAEAMKLCVELAEIGNRNLATDTAIAAILFDSAFFCAKFNVYINLKYMKDTGYIENVHKLLTGIERSIPEQKELILEKCEEVIK